MKILELNYDREEDFKIVRILRHEFQNEDFFVKCEIKIISMDTKNEINEIENEDTIPL